MQKRFISFWIFLLVSSVAQAKLVQYTFKVDKKVVNFAGKEVETIAIGDQIPAPTIEATVGDMLEVTFENNLDTQTSIHWHGVLLPHDQDGVPHLNTPPIQPKTSFTYRFPIKHAGTYWYHSHTGLQEQQGIYGGLIFHPKSGERVPTKHEKVVVLSDWTNEDPEQVMANIKKDGDYYALKKGSVQSWDQVLKHGPEAIKNRLHGSWTRMGPMDISDVGYDAFLLNGARESSLHINPSETVRLRIINAATSTYFNLEFAGGPLTVVSSDGMDVKPLKVKRLRISPAETYDIIVHAKDHKAYELRSSSEDGTGHSSLFIGHGEKVFAPNIPKPNLFLSMHHMHGNHMNHGASAGSKTNHHMGHDMHKPHMKPEKQEKPQPMMHHTDHQTKPHMDHGMRHHMREKMNHDMGKKMHHTSHMPIEQEQEENVIEYMTDYRALKAVHDTSLPKDRPHRTVHLTLEGNMERYVWGFNNKTLIESDKVLVRRGEVVRFVLENKTMMHHPIHLHGHFFRVLNGQGDRSPLKHTVNVPPMETVEIEFDANEEKDWFFHCHNLYHAKSGMSGVLSYEGSTMATKETFSKLFPDTWFFAGDVAGLSNMTMGSLRYSNSRNAIEVEYDYNYKRAYDTEVTYSRSLTRFLEIYAGGNFEREKGEKKAKNKGIIGVHYVLPMLIEANLRLNSDAKLRLSLGSELQLTERTKLEWSWNTNHDYRGVLSYEIKKNILLSATYDSDFRWGAGLRVKF